MYTIHPTRFPELAYIKQAPGLWRFVATDALPNVNVVGPQYPTKAELLADLPRYPKANWGIE